MVHRPPPGSNTAPSVWGGASVRPRAESHLDALRPQVARWPGVLGPPRALGQTAGDGRSPSDEPASPHPLVGVAAGPLPAGGRGRPAPPDRRLDPTPRRGGGRLRGCPSRRERDRERAGVLRPVQHPSRRARADVPRALPSRRAVGGRSRRRRRTRRAQVATRARPAPRRAPGVGDGSGHRPRRGGARGDRPQRPHRDPSRSITRLPLGADRGDRRGHRGGLPVRDPSHARLRLAPGARPGGVGVVSRRGLPGGPPRGDRARVGSRCGGAPRVRITGDATVRSRGRRRAPGARHRRARRPARRRAAEPLDRRAGRRRRRPAAGQGDRSGRSAVATCCPRSGASPSTGTRGPGSRSAGSSRSSTRPSCCWWRDRPGCTCPGSSPPVVRVHVPRCWCSARCWGSGSPTSPRRAWTTPCSPRSGPTSPRSTGPGWPTTPSTPRT